MIKFILNIFSNLFKLLLTINIMVIVIVLFTVNNFEYIVEELVDISIYQDCKKSKVVVIDIFNTKRGYVLQDSIVSVSRYTPYEALDSFILYGKDTLIVRNSNGFSHIKNIQNEQHSKGP